MKVGDYVRIKNEAGWCCIGNIVKINEFREPAMKCCKYCIDIQGEDYIYVSEDIIAKSSPNIIDLLEKSDLVVDYTGNVYKVDCIYDGYVFTTFIGEDGITKTLTDYQIKSIVTHEQFESMEYKVGE